MYVLHNCKRLCFTRMMMMVYNLIMFKHPVVYLKEHLHRRWETRIMMLHPFARQQHHALIGWYVTSCSLPR